MKNPQALHKIGYGVYVVCSKGSEKINGQIVNSIIQVTSEPATVAISINRQNLTHEYISASRVFTVSILSRETPLNFIANFGFKSGRDIDKFKGVKYKSGALGAPIILDNAIACLEAEVIDQLEVGTHTIFIGKITEAEIFSNAEPMTYAYYHDVKRGTSPKTAPTYLKTEDKKQGGINMKKYVCKVCGYIYDPANGDPDSGIQAGTAFEDLPDTWVCPVCGVGKDQFEVAA